MPSLLPENSDLWQLLTYSPAIWVQGMMDIAGLDFGQLRILAEILGVELDRRALAKIRAYERAYLQHIRGKDDNGGRTTGV